MSCHPGEEPSVSWASHPAARPCGSGTARAGRSVRTRHEEPCTKLLQAPTVLLGCRMRQRCAQRLAGGPGVQGRPRLVKGGSLLLTRFHFKCSFLSSDASCFPVLPSDSVNSDHMPACSILAQTSFWKRMRGKRVIGDDLLEVAHGIQLLWLTRGTPGRPAEEAVRLREKQGGTACEQDLQAQEGGQEARAHPGCCSGYRACSPGSQGGCSVTEAAEMQAVWSDRLSLNLSSIIF